MRRLLALGLLTLSIASAAALEPPRLREAEQDSTGVIWGFAVEDQNTAFTFDGSQWTALDVPLPPGKQANAKKTTKLSDGAVACLWKLDNKRMAFTWQRGKEVRLLGECPGTVPQRVNLIEDSRGRLWATSNSREIHRLDVKNGNFFEYRLKQEDLLLPDKLWNTVDAVEDGRGRVWIYTNVTSVGKSDCSLRGVLLFDGDQAERRDIAGIPGQWITFLGRKDSTHMWLGVLDGGLYEVDIETLQANPVPSPGNGAFRHIDKVFSIGADLFVIDYSYNTALWRSRDRKWERLIENLGNCAPSERFVLPLPGGFLLSSNSYPWFVGDNRPPVRLDWRYGFTSEQPCKAFRCADGSLLAINSRAGWTFHKKIPLPPNSPLPLRVEEWAAPPGSLNTASPNGRFWSLKGDQYRPPGLLMEWNGESWIDHELPTDISAAWIRYFVADAEGRVWLLPAGQNRTASFFDSRTQEWHVFPKMEEAFVAARSDPPHFMGGRRGFCIPYYSADRKRIALRDGDWNLAYFDGSTWTRWKREQIAPQNNEEIDSPCFDAEDRLSVNVGETTWQFGGQNLWRQAPFERRFSDQYRGLGQPKIDPPDGCITKSPDAMEVDNTGTYWLTWQRALYKCRAGSCVRVFSETEPNPFTSGQALRAVWVDPSGNALVETNTPVAHWFRISPKSPPPKTSIAVEPTAADCVRVRLLSHSPGKVQFHWQFDDEPWQSTVDQSITLNFLPNGEHTLKAQAFDDDLQSDPIPVEAKFTIKIDPALQLRTFIARLADPDFARRKAAITALARQPATSLPALKAARPEANDDQRWWIDAAIQQIERSQRASSKNLQ